MTDLPAVTEPIEPTGVAIRAHDPIALADLVLGVAALRSTTGVMVIPRVHDHVFVLEEGARRTPLGSIPSELADALVARLSILAGLEVGVAKGLGKVRTALKCSPGSSRRPATEILISVRRGRRGLRAELHRLAGAGDAVATSAAGSDAELCGPYRLIEVLGEGGMGVVYRAVHELLGKSVAVKVLKPLFAEDPWLVEQLLVEGRAACLAHHPNIVEVTDFGRTSTGHAYLVMELVEAPTLATLLSAGPLPFDRVARIGRQVASALAAASEQGVVHRDLKPSNVFVDREDHVKIGDFGIARIAGDSSALQDSGVRGWVGTPSYMSPEQAAGAEVDTRSDLYSLGCVLFEMLTGTPPFVRATAVAAAEAHACDSLPPLERAGEDLIPPVLDRIVRCALAKHPDERYPSAASMRDDLEVAEQLLAASDWRRWLP